MKKENLFYLIFISTIILLRLGIFIFPERNLIILGFLIHHFWFGCFALAIYFLIPKKYTKLKITILAIGSGLIFDQLVFMLLGAGYDKEYWALPSTIGTIILAIIVFFLRKKLK